MPAPEQAQMLDRLTSRAATLGPTEIRARFRAAAAEFDAAVAGLTEAEARREVRPGEWTIAHVVDHLAQTTIRCVEELRHLLAGRRPPAPPVYEGLTSGAATRVPWGELCDGLRTANAELDGLLTTTIGREIAETATVQAILVVPRPESTESETFAAELGWRAYALVQRLHLLEHRNQVRQLRALLER
jgi:DinB superfamily